MNRILLLGNLLCLSLLSINGLSQEVVITKLTDFQKSLIPALTLTPDASGVLFVRLGYNEHNLDFYTIDHLNSKLTQVAQIDSMIFINFTQGVGNENSVSAIIRDYKIKFYKFNDILNSEESNPINRLEKHELGSWYNHHWANHNEGLFFYSWRYKTLKWLLNEEVAEIIFPHEIARVNIIKDKAYVVTYNETEGVVELFNFDLASRHPNKMYEAKAVWVRDIEEIGLYANEDETYLWFQQQPLKTDIVQVNNHKLTATNFAVNSGIQDMVRVGEHLYFSALYTTNNFFTVQLWKGANFKFNVISNLFTVPLSKINSGATLIIPTNP